MKIRISSNNIKSAVKKVFSAADKRGNIPILSNILFEAEDNILKLTATNLEIGVSTFIDCEVTESGKTTVNAQKCAKLFSSLIGEEFEVETDDSKLIVKSANSRFSLATLPPEEFPEIEFPESFGVKLSSSDIDRAIKKVSYAVSKDEARYILTGVYFRSFGDKIHAVATDGHRLALFEMKAEAEEFSSIIPRKALSELKKLLKESDEIELLGKENKIFFRIGDTLFWSSVIDGEYPDYMAVIPEDNPLECIAIREELVNALKEVSVIYDKEEIRAVILNLTPGNLRLIARKMELDSASEEAEVNIPVEYSGEEFEIGFNINHLLEAVSSFDGDTIKILMDQPISPVLIVSEEEPELKNVIMPMKV
ncbi:DNA polymerase III, beta subunit [Desulfurobacterium thermolithotrophum DSM 11699]|uniref:Beta sliding clamp n=1 Tax=Desulfurobacterium thermolithotrophum (strain DSM 11699 / BSA) TaxID=868864 RepID=F0S0D6_DESTD|nr:DNA polymerase III subunit beta [Desulfurobacterium thermolithotrophum]ADY72664.1 DNA polymerase III, beta subunit [Desulfurobacterium thermolithotrophum DSM 11699]